MRPPFAFVLATALMIGAADAAPSFGSKSHRVGGGSSNEQKEPATVFESVLGLIGLSLSAKVAPLVSEERSRTRAKECDQAKKAQVAKAETRESEGASSKGRSRPSEPVYLAF